MTHSELVKELSSDLGKTQKETAEILDKLVKKVHDKLSAGEKVTLKGLVSIETKVVPAHKSKNPRTKEEVDVPEKIKPVVKATNALKEVVNK